MTDSPSVTWPSPAMTTLSLRRTQRTVVERILRRAGVSAVSSVAAATSVFFIMSAILNYTAHLDGETGASPVRPDSEFSIQIQRYAAGVLTSPARTGLLSMYLILAL